jgi:hypothetical protein
MRVLEIDKVIQADCFCVFNMYNIVQKQSNISIAPVRSWGGSMVFNNVKKSFNLIGSLLVHSMFGNERAWKAAAFYETVFSQKEAVEREREEESLAAPLWRRREGRIRRRASSLARECGLRVE